MTRLLLLLALGGAGCVMSAEGEIPDVEVTRHAVAIPGVPGEARLVEPVISVPVSFDPRDHLSLDKNAYHSVVVREVLLQTNMAGGDLSFVRSLRMTIAGVSAAPPIEVLRYQRNDSAPPVGATLLLSCAARRSPTSDKLKQLLKQLGRHERDEPRRGGMESKAPSANGRRPG